MQHRQIINVINFIRGCEPRSETDLVTPVREQIDLMQKHGLRGTFLLQYDALIRPDFQALLRPLDPEQFELGVWYEYNQPLVEKAGLVWRGRFPWDWHSDCAMSVGYTEAEREACIDVLFRDFQSIFGYLPRSLGGWAFDAHSIAYAHDRYGLTAACNCKEQWGTDGYNLWGGYYGQAYYPAKTNAFAPAQQKANQIDVPVFRMLGSDPVLQYDFGLDLQEGIGCQKVITLEPAYESAGGGNPDWVDWYLRENFNGKCLSFGYAQAGQENSFGWPSMKDGLTSQFEKIAALQAAGKLVCERLCDSGAWYRQTYAETPASAIVADDDWSRSGKRSAWYCCRNYRANLYAENGSIWLRDLYLFRDAYHERYLGSVCGGSVLTYDNLPVVDGARFSGDGIRAGLYPFVDGEPLTFEGFDWSEQDGAAVVTLTGTQAGTVTVTFTETGISVLSDREIRFVQAFCASARAKWMDSASSQDGVFTGTVRGCTYQVRLTAGQTGRQYRMDARLDEPASLQA